VEKREHRKEERTVIFFRFPTSYKLVFCDRFSLGDGEREAKKKKKKTLLSLSLTSRKLFPFFSSPPSPPPFAMAQANRNPAAHPWHDLPIQAEVRENEWGW